MMMQNLYLSKNKQFFIYFSKDLNRLFLVKLVPGSKNQKKLSSSFSFFRRDVCVFTIAFHVLINHKTMVENIIIHKEKKICWFFFHIKLESIGSYSNNNTKEDIVGLWALFILLLAPGPHYSPLKKKRGAIKRFP